MGEFSHDLTGCRAVITAGASGIGLSVAEKFVACGARVHVGDIDEARLAQIGSSLRVGTTRCDVSRPADVERLFADAGEAMGGVTALINNVGIPGPTLPADQITVEEWDRVIRTNLSSFFYCVRRAIPMLRERGGTIINISSAAVRRGGFPRRLPYAASKSAIRGFTDTLAMDLGADNIRVHTVMPGTVGGARLDAVIDASAAATGISRNRLRRNARSSASMRTVISGEDVAHMIAFLCSDAARWVSGQEISICGNFEGHRSAT